jgi:hypothetical protein
MSIVSNERGIEAMTKREIFVVACKIFGIYLLVRAIELLQAIGYFFVAIFAKGDQGEWYMVGGLLPLVCYIVGAYCLIKWAEPVAARLSGAETTPAVKMPIDKSALQEIAFSTAGILIVVGALPRLVHIAPLLSQQWTHQRTLEIWTSIIGLVLQLGIGTFLFLGSRGLVGLIKKLKAI